MKLISLLGINIQVQNVSVCQIDRGQKKKGIRESDETLRYGW